MEFFEKPDLYPSAARVESDFRRTETILQYRRPDLLAEHCIAGLSCKRGPDLVCAAVFCHGRPGHQCRKPGQAVNY